MPRVSHKSSSQQSLIIFILIVLILIAISTNYGLFWFFNRSTNSRIEVDGNIKIAAEVLNGQTLYFTQNERLPGAVIPRTIHIQKDSEAKNFYLRMRTEVRIDGMTTSAVKLGIAEEDQPYWLKETATNGVWFYCYSDYNTWDALDPYRLPNVHLEFLISPDISIERLNRVMTVILYIEVVAVDENISHWQNLPANWPYVAPNEEA